jgi:sulfonate transport system substrate-binding protein
MVQPFPHRIQGAALPNDPTFRLRRRHVGPTLLALSAGASWFGRTAWAQAALPKEVRIGFQKGSAVLVLARKQEVIEKRLKALGVPNVKWVEFQFGPPMLEALGAGAIDIGSVGDAPPIFAQAGGSDLVYAAATPSAEHAVLVPRNSSIRTVAELRGKKVAFGKGSSAQGVTIRALATAGLTFQDITPVYLSPADATAAFNGGNVDAWVVWDPYYAIAEERYGARAIADTRDKRLASASYYIASREFATRYPAALVALLDEIGKLTVWSGQHRSDLAAIAADATGIDIKSWSAAFARADFSFGPITDAQVKQQQQLADTFVELGIIPRKINVKDIVWRAPSAS